MSHFFPLRSIAPLNLPGRALMLASGSALLAVVAPGLAQAQSNVFPILPPAPTMMSAMSSGPRATRNAAPAPSKTLTVTRFTPPMRRKVPVSKKSAANAFPLVNSAAKKLKAGQTAEALELYRRAYQIDPNNEYAAPGVGTSLIIQGKFSEAATTFLNYLAIRPNDPKALHGLADTLTYSKQYSKAAGVNNYILSLDSFDSRNYDWLRYASLYQNAKIATYAGDYKLSETYFTRAAGIKNSDPQFWVDWGKSLSYRRNPRAENAFNRALSLKSDNLEATQGLADYYSYTSQFARAVAPLETVVKAQPKNVKALVELGDALSYSKQPVAAVAYYEKALSLDSNNRDAMRGKADALTYSKQYSQATRVNDMILSLNARDYDALYQNAQIATYTGNYKLSETYFSRAAGVKNSDPQFWADWGESLLYRREPRALSAFNRALSLRPGYARATQGVANYYIYNSQFGSAVAPLQMILRADPNNFKALVSLGDALTYSDQPGNALSYYQKALSLNPRDLDARLGLGRALVFAGRKEEGATELRRVLAVSPDNIKALEVLVTTQDAAASAQAIQAYTTLLSRTPEPAKKAKILASIGDLQLGAAVPEELKLSQLNSAIDSYQQAQALAPNDPAINLSYAQLLSYRTDYDLAAPLVESVLVAQPDNISALALQTQIAGGQARLSESNNGPDSSQLQARADQLAAGLVRFRPRTAQEALSFVDAFLITGKSESALEYLKLASSFNNESGRNPVIGLRIANAMRDSGSTEDAVPLYNDLLRTEPNNVPVRVNLAKALLYANTPQNNTLPEANIQLSQALQLEPNNSEALVFQLELNLAGGEFAKAEQGARALLAQGANSDASITLGAVFSSRGQFNEGIEQYQTALQTAPDDVDAQIGLARNLYYARRVDESIVAYQRLIQLTPNETLPRLELAKVFLDRNRLAEAETLFNTVLEQQQRGVAALPSSTIGGGRGALARLSSQSIKDSFVNKDSFAKLPAALGKAANKTIKATPKAVALDETQVLKVVTVALAQVKPRTRVAQSASPTVGVGGSAPPAAAFPGGLIAPDQGETTTNDGATSAEDDSFVPTVPLPPTGGMRDRQTVPRVPADAGETNTFLAPLTPGGAARTTAKDQIKAYNGLGEIRLRQGRYVEALQQFKNALKIAPDSVDAHLGAARVLRAQNNYTAAFDEVNKALTSGQSIEQINETLRNNSKDTAAIIAQSDNFRARILRAQLLGDQGQSQEAQDALNELQSSLPENISLETLLRLIEALNSLKNYSVALQVLQVASQLYPDDMAPVRLRAETLNFAGRIDESVALYDQIIAANPLDDDAIVGKARVYNYANQLPLAETTYRQALTVQPANYQAQIELADVLGRRGNYPDSIQLYALAIQGNPKDLTSRLELARVQRYAGREGDAEATLNQILDADDRNVEALTERGILRGVQGSYAPAIADLQTALQIAPRSQTALLGLAQVQGYAGQYEQSIAGYRAVLQSDPNNEKARTELGQMLSYAGDDAGALKELDTVLGKNPTSIVALLAKADILGRSNRTADAVRIYNSVLTADPRNVRARSGLADTYVTGRRYTDAIKIYDQLIATEPKNSTYKISRARALGYNRQSAQASEALRAVIAAEPDNKAARLAFAEVGTNSGNRGLRAGAINEYRRLITADPTNVPARVGLARALSYQGQTKEAESTLKTVLAAQPSNVEARVALGGNQRFSGKPFEARDSYKAALTADPGNVSAQTGLDATRRATRPSVGVSYSSYNDTNGVRLKSVNESASLRTRGGVIGVIAEQGRFEQGPFRSNRNNIGLTFGKNFGPVQATAAVSRLKYDGAPERFLYDLLLLNSSVERRRYYLGTGRRDIYESAQAVAQGITATTYRGGFNVPVGQKLDFEVQGVYYRYSDDNSRYSILPALYYRLRPTNPSLRLGVGYAYDDTRQKSNIYYTPQGYSAFSLLADYQNTLGKTRYGFNAGVPLTNATGPVGINRPADTLFGFISRDVGNSLELFANGGIVRSPDFKSDQIAGGVNYTF